MTSKIYIYDYVDNPEEGIHSWFIVFITVSKCIREK